MAKREQPERDVAGRDRPQPERDGAERELGRDRDVAGRPRQGRPRDALGRPLEYGDPRGVEPVPEEALPPAAALALAQSLVDGGRAFGAHEVLEAVWKSAPEPERDLWQGLAQLCVAITHSQRENPDGAATLAARARRRLAGYVDAPPYGIDIPGLLTWLSTWDGDAAPPRLLRRDQAQS
jgi:hypothetical protein